MALFGSEQIGREFPDHFRGPILYETNGKAFATAKISLNLHVTGGFSGWYANARTTEILGSGGLLLTDDVAEGPVTHMKECVILRSREPAEVVKQVKAILASYNLYLGIKERGKKLASTSFSADEHASRLASAILRVWSKNRS
jgi:spore maturation protein CgeB